jgi:hypothetical protein
MPVSTVSRWNAILISLQIDEGVASDAQGCLKRETKTSILHFAIFCFPANDDLIR